MSGNDGSLGQRVLPETCVGALSSRAANVVRQSPCREHSIFIMSGNDGSLGQRALPETCVGALFSRAANVVRQSHCREHSVVIMLGNVRLAGTASPT
jgi:hypothetical protein